MIRLYLVRHAIAGERDVRKYPDDALRPLTTQGARRFKRATRGLKTLLPEVDCLLCSPLLRARQTAAILHEAADLPQPREEPALAPGSSSARVLAALREYQAQVLVVVGHEPALSRLLTVCTAGANARVAVRFRKGAVACVSFGAAPRVAQGTLEWLLQPRILRKLGKPPA